jgi:hypothetical protein
LPYINDFTCYRWLGAAAKAARWLGYVDFERIVDNRNDEPTTYVPEDTKPRDGELAWVSRTHNPLLPAAADLMPEIGLDGVNFIQPFRIILAGEKSSLQEALLPIAEEIHGELILPSGEFSDTLVHGFVSRAAEDGRPAVVIYFSDFDPAGNQMPVSVSRKIQALRDLKFPDLTIEMHHAALTIEQVRRLDLPSTPLKPKEKRADRWREFTGQEQTEIDALMALHPGELRRIAREAVAPFYDFDAADRHDEAMREWRHEVNMTLKANPAYADALAQLRAVIGRMQEGVNEIRRIKDAVHDIPTGDLPPFEMPPCEPEGERPEPMFDSRESWLDQTRRLQKKRNLIGDDADDGDNDE